MARPCSALSQAPPLRKLHQKFNWSLQTNKKFGGGTTQGRRERRTQCKSSILGSIPWDEGDLWTSGWAGAAPPIDAPLGVNLQDGGVLGIVVRHLGVGKLSTIDVDDNGDITRAHSGGRQTPYLPGIPPGGARWDSEDVGATAHLPGRLSF